MRDVAIVVMAYKDNLTDMERVSFERCLNVFSRRDIYVACPWDMSKDEYSNINGYKTNISFINLERKWFNSVMSYSKMLMQKWFYEMFSDYKYILVYQLDCYVFKDNLNYFMDMDYDYYGAPWLWSNVLRCVGNGGLSLRKVSAIIENLEERADLDYINSDECEYFIEDFAYCTGFFPLKNICPYDVADKFSFETNILLRDPDKMAVEDFPMGCHGFSKEDEIYCMGQPHTLKNLMGRAIKRWNELGQ